MKRIALALFVAFVAQSPLQAGVVFEIESTDYTSAKPQTHEMQVAVEGQNLRMTTQAGPRDDDGTMIYRGVRKEILAVNHGDKTYFVMDRETLTALAGQVTQAMQMVEEALKDVPAEQRAMVEQLVRNNLPAETKKGTPAEVRKTSEKADKQGFPCQKYEVWRKDRKIREFWVTDWARIEGGKDAVAAFEGMAEFFKEMLESLRTGSAESITSQLESNPYAFMKELGGYPVVVREFGDDGSLENESLLRSAKRQRLDPAEFKAPEGYQRQIMPGVE